MYFSTFGEVVDGGGEGRIHSESVQRSNTQLSHFIKYLIGKSKMEDPKDPPSTQ
jgi:hypothetical protein